MPDFADAYLQKGRALSLSDATRRRLKHSGMYLITNPDDLTALYGLAREQTARI